MQLLWLKGVTSQSGLLRRLMDSVIAVFHCGFIQAGK